MYQHRTDVLPVCRQCGDDSGICDRCYEMDITCSDTNHVLTRYVVFKGEKQISKQFTEKDCCQFCKEQIGGSVFYCECWGKPVLSQLLFLI